MGMFNEIRSHPLRALKTVCMYSAFTSIGFSLSILGPTLPDLCYQVQRGIGDVALLLPVRAGGYALGSLLMGFIYNYLNFQLAAGVCMAITAGMTVSIPFIYDLWTLFPVFFVNGCFLGFFEAGTNMFLLHLWGRAVGPFMQFLHFWFGIGALIIPNIVKPFLVSREDVSNASSVLTSSSLLNDTEMDTSGQSDVKLFPRPEDLLLHYPYSIVAGHLALNAIFYFVLYLLYPLTPAHPSRIDIIDPVKRDSPVQLNGQGKQEDPIDSSQSSLPDQFRQEEVDKVTRNNAKTYSKCTIIGLCLLFMHIYYGLEISFGSFLTTYVLQTESLPIDTEAERKATGVMMTALFWTMFTFVRLGTVFFADLVSPEWNIFGSLGIALIGNVVLIPFTSSLSCLWAGVAIVGAGISALWAALFTFLDMYFSLNPKIAAGLIVSAIAGEFTFPLIMSRVIEKDSSIFLWVVLFCTLSITFLFFVMFLIGRCRLERVLRRPDTPKGH